MKSYPINFKYTSTFQLIPAWVPELLQNWLDEGWTCDITVKHGPRNPGARRVVVVEITASTSADLAAKRKAFNKMIEAQGYGPEANKL